ncbi:MAPEG family protein [Sphingosinithalassobacter portus]|uniref:MAPEG family protein n=1 Tax=Stakelama portus TaxID=2676234 RepID=UPI000D6E6645|nr:MAPEG family protein [Sphingosinithalassobacter portus]
MTVELAVLTWGCVLALVHIFAAAAAKTAQYGSKWNMGARDAELPRPNPLNGRLVRAQNNFFETFPIVIALILTLSAAGMASETTAMGALLWLGARIIYLPLYALGIPVVRTLVFLASVVGIAMLGSPLIGPALSALF